VTIDDWNDNFTFDRRLLVSQLAWDCHVRHRSECLAAKTSHVPHPDWRPLPAIRLGTLRLVRTGDGPQSESILDHRLQILLW
jgi:hypothetical protein